MSGGGSGGGATKQEVTQTNLPAYARPYFERLMGRGEAASNQRYEEYPGQRISTFTPDQKSSFEGARNLQETYLPSFNQASQAYTGALDQAGRAVSGYDPNVEMFGQDAAQRYMNPYIGNVLSQAQQAAQQNFLESQGGRASQAVKSGAFGGSRATIADEVARRTYDSQFQSLTADLLDKGYSNAQAQFMADRNARDAANQYKAKLGMEGADFGLRSGTAMAGLGTEAYRLGSAQSELLNKYGTQQQGLQQKQYDVDYGNFINQRDQERNNTAYLSSLLRGVPVNPQSNVITYQQQPDALTQLGGLGLGAYGLLK